MVAGVIGEGVGKTETEIVKKLREEIVGLRAEIEILRQHKLGFDLLALDADDLRKRPLVSARALRGEKLADLPVQAPTKYELSSQAVTAH